MSSKSNREKSKANLKAASETVPNSKLSSQSGSKRKKDDLSSTESSPELLLKKQKEDIQKSPPVIKIIKMPGTNIEEIITRAVQKAKEEFKDLLKEEFTPVKRLVADFENDLRKTKSDIGQLQKNERRKNIIVYGIDEKPGETYNMRNQAIENLAVQLKIPKIDYDEAIRLGKFAHDKTRPLLIKCLRQRDKFQIMESTRNLRGTKISIREDMSPEERKRNNELLKKRFEIRQVHPTAPCKIRNEKLYVSIGTQQATYIFNPITQTVEEERENSEPMIIPE